MLETRTLADYYEEVVLRGLRLAVADVDRGAVQRSAMRGVCETVLEVLEGLADHRDQDGFKATLAAPATANADDLEGQRCLDLQGRTVICAPGRGPLDAAVAEMMSQLLRRAGCQVRALSRDATRHDENANFADDDDVDAICILGLFDDRSFRRMRPVVQHGRKAAVLIGVRRSDEAGSASASDTERPLATLSAFCEAIHALTDSSPADIATANQHTSA